MYNFQIETSFVNLNLLAGNPGSAPASTIYFILFTWASPYGTHMEPDALPIWDPYRSSVGAASTIFYTFGMVRPGFEPTTVRSESGRPTNWAIEAVDQNWSKRERERARDGGGGMDNGSGTFWLGGVLNVTHPQILRIQQTSSSLGRKYPDILHGSLQNFCVKVW